MARGRKPLPAAVKRLRGNPGKRKIMEQLKLPVEIPAPPADLIPDERVEYDRLCVQLHGMKMLTTADAWAVVNAARNICAINAYSADLQARGYTVEDTKTGQIIPNPSHAARLNAEKALSRFFSDFGLNPSARMKVKPEGSEEKPRDEFEDHVAQFQKPA